MKLFESIEIRGMVLKNRIVMAPMQVGVGLRNQRARAYFVERARGGAGCIIAQGTSVDLFLFDETWRRPGGADSFVEGLRSFTSAIHEAGAKVGIQLWHGNRLPAGTGAEDDTRGELVAPSARGEMRQLAVAEIESIIDKFARAAARTSPTDLILPTITLLLYFHRSSHSTEFLITSGAFPPSSATLPAKMLI